MPKRKNRPGKSTDRGTKVLMYNDVFGERLVREVFGTTEVKDPPTPDSARIYVAERPPITSLDDMGNHTDAIRRDFEDSFRAFEDAHDTYVACSFALGRGEYCAGDSRWPSTHATICPYYEADPQD